jgi:hypothetical protein
MLAVLGSCHTSTEPKAGSLRGLGFHPSITSQEISQVEELGTILAVVQSARVMLIYSDASPTVLLRVPRVVEVGPPLGSASGLHLEASALFPGAPSAAQLAAMEEAGTITGVLPEVHWYVLLVPVEKLEKLDGIVGATEISVEIHHAARY